VQSLVRKGPSLAGQHFCSYRSRENRATVNLWNTRLHCCNSLSRQLQPSRLPDLGKLQERVYRSRIHDVAQLKSRFIEEWEHFNQMINWSSMKQSDSDVHVFKLAFECVGNSLNADFKCVWLLHFTVTCLNVVNSGHFVFSGDLAKLVVRFADVGRFYWDLVICLRIDVILLVQNLVKIWCCWPEL